MKNLLLLGFLCSVIISNAQKVVKKSIINPNISFIQIDGSNCFKILVETANTNEMKIEASIEGEYKKDLLLNVKEEGSTIQVSSEFQPNFINPNDKLSAHKVLSIVLRIQLPKYKNVHVYGTSCNVTLIGSYKHLKVSLNDGICSLNDVSERVEVLTQSGDINVSASNADITANSKYGTVEQARIPIGKNQYKLNTTTGNIYLKKME